MITPAQLFGLLSDETRLRCLLLLQVKKELCVCELTSALRCSQPKISRHLSMLRTAGIILDERRGQWVYYRLNSGLPKWILKILRASLSDLKIAEPYVSDCKRLRSDRTQPRCG